MTGLPSALPKGLKSDEIGIVCQLSLPANIKPGCVHKYGQC